MTLVVAWVVFPLLIAAVTLGAGLALEAVAATRIPFPLLLPAGLAAVVVAMGFHCRRSRRPGCFGPRPAGTRRSMKVFTKRNALVGWLVLRVARRRARQRLDALVGRRGLALGAGAVTAAGVGAVVVLSRRESTAEPHHA